MKEYSSTLIDYHNGESRNVKVCIIVVAKNKATELLEELCIWTGDQDATFIVDGESKSFVASSIIGIDPFRFNKGLDVMTQTVRLTSAVEEVKVAMMNYVIHMASVRVYLAHLDPITDDLVEPLGDPFFDGFIDKAPETVDGNSGQELVLTLVSISRRITRRSYTKKSHEAALTRDGDEIMQYSFITGKVNTYWGMSSP